MNSPLVLLLGPDDDGLRAQIRQIAPDIEILTPDDEGALQRANIVYDALSKKDSLEGADNLRWIQVASAGVNGWRLDELQKRGIQLTTTSGIHAQPITEQMFGMLLMRTRALDEAQRVQPQHKWRGEEFPVQLISGKTLGLLGVGAIGEYAANIGAAFGMRVIGLRHSGKPIENVEQMYAPDDRLDFFGRCDVVMNTLPLTDDTRDFMGAAEFDALPAGAIVINTGRGATINTPALMAWLQRDAANFASLDVTEPEPLPADHPLWNLPNVLLTSHSSGNFPDYMERANAIFTDNLKRFIEGEDLVNLVNADAGY